MLEAVSMGCFPLAPRALSYPELFPSECLYNTERQLVKRLKTYCRYPDRVRRQKEDVMRQIKPEQYHWSHLKPRLHLWDIVGRLGTFGTE